MGVIEKAVNWAVAIAADQSHGYSQVDRWGPDYDCSSFVISAFEQAGVAVREAGASYTGNMYGAFLSCGFQDVSGQVDLNSGYSIQAGDVLLNKAAHTCIAIGGGRVANCRTDEGHPQSGDQGQEIRVQSFWPYPWDCCLRYMGNESTVASSEPATPAEPRTTLKKGMSGADVKDLQERLNLVGCLCGKADGDYGNLTFRAVAEFQEKHGIPVTGVADPETIRALKDMPAAKVELRLPNLYAGSRNDAVEFLQAALNLVNFNCGTADGIFGAKTAAAVNRFKDSAGVQAYDQKPDGSVDADTWEALLNELMKGVRK